MDGGRERSATSGVGCKMSFMEHDPYADVSVHSTTGGKIAFGSHKNSVSGEDATPKKGKKLMSFRRSMSRLSIPRNLSKMSLSSYKSTGSNTSLDSLEDTSENDSAVSARARSSSKTLKSSSTTTKTFSDSIETAFYNFGVAQCPGKKNQDRFDARLGSSSVGGEGVAYFGVFDGHGTSALAADLCVERLHEEIQMRTSCGLDSDDTETLSLGSGDPVTSLDGDYQALAHMPSDEALISSHLRLDELVQANRHTDPRAGTCSVSVFLERHQDGTTEGKVAWVGDCRAILISSENDVFDLTLDHRIDDNEEEYVRISQADHTPRRGLLTSELWRREVEKAAQAGADPRRLRAHSFVEQRQINGRYVGPRCVFSHTGGVSLQVTRSIGDAYAARSVIPNPDITNFSLEKDKYARIVLGSDGVFDVMSSTDVAKFVSKMSNPTKAASKLAHHCRQKRLYSGMASDDITVQVIDVNREHRDSKAFKRVGKHAALY